jgi:hypothetical protein
LIFSSGASIRNEPLPIMTANRVAPAGGGASWVPCALAAGAEALAGVATGAAGAAASFGFSSQPATTARQRLEHVIHPFIWFSSRMRC